MFGAAGSENSYRADYTDNFMQRVTLHREVKFPAEAGRLMLET